MRMHRHSGIFLIGANSVILHSLPFTTAKGILITDSCISMAASSSFASLNTTFLIKYGTGAASGTLGVDRVQMAGFQVENQVFGQNSRLAASQCILTLT